jgi:tetratricopeptide (TPR) repeat protein
MFADSKQILNPAYEFLKSGNTIRAKTLVEDALTDDLDNQEVISALRFVNFWAGKLDDPEGAVPEDRGDFLLRSWRRFLSFVSDKDKEFDRCLSAVRTGVFSRALDEFLEALGGVHKNPREGELYRKAGICHKKLGEYETALAFLSQANTLRPDTPAILSELADCYALCGNERMAKMLFKEAFFLEPQQIDAAFLDCMMIIHLLRQVEKKGYAGDELLEWMPVYGVLYGIFNIKRELRPPEVSRLKQEIFRLEIELNETHSALIVPRLINHYFWLIDHFHLAAVRGSGTALNEKEETERKIKGLNAAIYKQYAGNQSPA